MGEVAHMRHSRTACAANGETIFAGLIPVLNLSSFSSSNTSYKKETNILLITDNSLDYSLTALYAYILIEESEFGSEEASGSGLFGLSKLPRCCLAAKWSDEAIHPRPEP